MKRFFTRQPAVPPTDTAAAGERQGNAATRASQHQRRRFTRALLVSVPVAAAAVAAAEPQPVQAAAATDTWKMEGNANVDGNDFLGTTNAKPLIVKTSNKERMRIREDGLVGIGTAPGSAQLAVSSGNGSAIRAETTAGSAASGVLGLTSNVSADTAGVRGAHMAGGTGIVGTSDTSIGGSSATGIGVKGTAEGFGTGVQAAGHIGIHGITTSPNSGNAYAGLFSGNVRVDGGLSAGGQATGSSFGVHGTSNALNGRGLSGVALASTSKTIGVFGTAASNEGTAVVGDSTAASGAPVGVHARVAAPGGVALKAEATSTSGSANGAVIITNARFGTGLYVAAPNVALYAEQTRADGIAAYFKGDIVVEGTNTIGNSVRTIDHPLDPANKYLSHAFVESPDMLSVYNGTVTTDARGTATVELPGYCEALNREFRYQLTVIGQFAQAIVARKVEHNRFTIQTDKPNVEVSWQLTGIRKDAFAEAHPVVAEADKPEHELGSFLHPREHGQPEDRGLHAGRRRQQ